MLPPRAAALYLAALADYVPDGRVDNAYFARLSGREPQWFERRTGVRSRSRAAPGENTNTMAIEAVSRLAAKHAAELARVGLVIGATYTPWDTIGTLAHTVQRHFGLQTARAMLLSSACSSFVDALEVATAYLELGRAGSALLVATEHNSLYASDDDPTSGHLWGDGAVAALVTAEPVSAARSLRILETTAAGLACVGTGPEAVRLEPRGAGLVMPHGKDVFHHACLGMEQTARTLLARRGLQAQDVRLFVAHQANRRIIDHVAEHMGLEEDQLATTLEDFGNTGCASAPITLSRNLHRLRPGDFALMVVFGGGYSAGGVLLRME
ncbi:MAG: ketoacyl-ACP synthase III [Gammaproteobacteria bacterium]|nr:ketoacyl-ACP synthase III [Gammaproteobacteria bacterium]